MPSQTREEWFAALQVGDTASATLPDDESPSIGTVESVSSDGVHVRFAGREFLLHFDPEGKLLGSPSCLLWMVSTGSGGSVGPPIQLSNVIQKLEERALQ